MNPLSPRRLETAARTLFLLAALQAPAARAAGSCQEFDVPVTVGGLPANIHGTLCLPNHATSTVMALVHGSTYNHTYWDFPYRPNLYNFRSKMNQAGFATAVIDKLGSGLSSRPPSELVTKDAQIDAIHAVLQALRAGQVGAQAFAKVILGGHSNGSVDAIGVAWRYPQDANGVLITGFTHRIDVPQVLYFLSTTYAAALDPKFMNAVPPYDPGYITTMPGTRYSNFYAPAVTDWAVVDLDEETKDVLSLPESAGGQGISTDPAITQSIQVPVLMVHGEFDTIFTCSEGGPPCTAAQLGAQESTYFSPSACLQVFVLPAAGHSLNLFPNANEAWAAVLNWANDFVGRGPGPVTPPPGACP